ncbi:hypothetical protein LSAT2_002578 [Lamellibrachia satsuma]|nr:hypothetical protein LSAT2_002578 [Lamellibrachia satsuma]
MLLLPPSGQSCSPKHRMRHMYTILLDPDVNKPMEFTATLPMRINAVECGRYDIACKRHDTECSAVYKGEIYLDSAEEMAHLQALLVLCLLVIVLAFEVNDAARLIRRAFVAVWYVLRYVLWRGPTLPELHVCLLRVIRLTSIEEIATWPNTM